MCKNLPAGQTKPGSITQCWMSRDSDQSMRRDAAAFLPLPARHKTQRFCQITPKAIYRERAETIERVFADAKEKHGLRYTALRGKAKVTMQALLTFACMNLKKLAVWKSRDPRFKPKYSFSLPFFPLLIPNSNICMKNAVWA